MRQSFYVDGTKICSIDTNQSMTFDEIMAIFDYIKPNTSDDGGAYVYDRDGESFTFSEDDCTTNDDWYADVKCHEDTGELYVQVECTDGKTYYVRDDGACWMARGPRDDGDIMLDSVPDAVKDAINSKSWLADDDEQNLIDAIRETFGSEA